MMQNSFGVTFLRNGPIPAYFCLFSLFSCYNFNTNWKKHRWCAWDSNPGMQDGRCRRNHRAMAATFGVTLLVILIFHFRTGITLFFHPTLFIFFETTICSFWNVLQTISCCWAVVVAQWLLPKPEVWGSNPAKLYDEHIYWLNDKNIREWSIKNNFLFCLSLSVMKLKNLSKSWNQTEDLCA